MTTIRTRYNPFTHLFEVLKVEKDTQEKKIVRILHDFKEEHAAEIYKKRLIQQDTIFNLLNEEVTE